jgi:predicted DCC family thiol-disulfide oxidoreductase YuxK
MKGVRFPLTVYYDASCPMCVSELHALRDAEGKGGLQLVDCSASDFDDSACDGVTRDAMMARLHARDAGGQWLVAMGVYEAVYAAAGLHTAARLWGNPWLRPILDRAYFWIARHRHSLSRLGANRLMRWLVPIPQNRPRS